MKVTIICLTALAFSTTTAHFLDNLTKPTSPDGPLNASPEYSKSEMDPKPLNNSKQPLPEQPINGPELSKQPLNGPEPPKVDCHEVPPPPPAVPALFHGSRVRRGNVQDPAQNVTDSKNGSQEDLYLFKTTYIEFGIVNDSLNDSDVSTESAEQVNVHTSNGSMTNPPAASFAIDSGSRLNKRELTKDEVNKHDAQTRTRGSTSTANPKIERS